MQAVAPMVVDAVVPRRNSEGASRYHEAKVGLGNGVSEELGSGWKYALVAVGVSIGIYGVIKLRQASRRRAV